MNPILFIPLVFLFPQVKAQSLINNQEVPIAAKAIATLHVKGYPDFLAADIDGVWVTNENRIEKLVFGNKEPVLSIAIPQPCGVMAIGFGSLWVASCQKQTVYRVNLSSGKIEANIQTGLADPEGELSIATGAGSVWLLTNKEGELSRIDPTTNSVIGRIKVAPHSYAVAFGYESLWVTNSSNASVQRIDPSGEKIIATLTVGKGPRFLDTGLGSVWTLNQEDGSVSKINPTTNSVTSINTKLAGTGGDIAVGAKYLFVRAKSTLLIAIHPITNQTVSRYGPSAGSGAVRIENGRVWVTAHDINTIWVMKE